MHREHREEANVPIEQTAPRDGHLDEGMAHAWLDGALDAVESARVEAHVAACAACSALVAEARGLVAGASRILGALDDVPGDVIPTVPIVAPPALVPLAPTVAPDVLPLRRRRTMFTPTLRAAAAVLVVAAGTGVVLARRGESPSAAARAAEQSAASASAPAPAGAPPVAPAVAAASEQAPPAASATARASTPPAVRAAEVPDAMTSLAAPSPAAPSPAAAAKTAARGAATAAAPSTLAQPADQRRDLEAALARSAAASGAARGTVAGVVRTDRGAPLAGANVLVAGMAVAAVSDSAGRFVLADVPAGDAQVTARRVGFASETRTVAVAPADTAWAALTLGPAVVQLSQTVVTSDAARRTPEPTRGATADVAPARERRAGGAPAAAPSAASAPRAAPSAGTHPELRALVPGCYLLRRTPPPTPTASALALPVRLVLRADGAGAAPWMLAPDGTLVVRLAPAADATELRLRRDHRGWTGDLTRGATTSAVTLTPTGGCDAR